MLHAVSKPQDKAAQLDSERGAGFHCLLKIRIWIGENPSVPD